MEPAEVLTGDADVIGALEESSRGTSAWKLN